MADWLMRLPHSWLRSKALQNSLPFLDHALIVGGLGQQAEAERLLGRVVSRG